MGVYICSMCHNYKDSDDSCHQDPRPNHDCDLACEDCMADYEESKSEEKAALSGKGE